MMRAMKNGIASSAPSDLEQRLCGAWSLIDWRSIAANGDDSFPFGEDAFGCLNYAPAKLGAPRGGVMSAQLAAQHRPAFRSGATELERAREKCAAFDSYVAYAGTWRTEGDRVIHRVVSSLYPNWIGTELVRTVRFVDEVLVLSTVPANRDGTIHALRWRRA